MLNNMNKQNKVQINEIFNEIILYPYIYSKR